MQKNRLLTTTLLCLLCTSVEAGNFDHEWFRIFGRWDGNQLRADNIQLRLPDKEANKGQISGQIDKIDLQNHRLMIGPFNINWSSNTKFERLSPEQLQVGMTLKISGQLSNAHGHQFIARSINKESSPFAAGSLQITGLSSTSFERKDGMHQFMMLNIPVYTPQNGYNVFKSLTRRQDVRRPDDQFKFNLFGKPVTIGGEYDLNPGHRDNFNLDQDRSDSSIRMDQELKLEAFYPISPFTAVFLSFKGITASRFNTDGNESVGRTTLEFARDETWIVFDRIADTGFGLQIGNQNVSETREWWWDKDMDALRLYYNRGSMHFELIGGKQLGGESTLRSINPSDEEVYRVMGLASWMWRSKQRLEFFFMKQWDKSAREHEDQLINKLNRDINDDNMIWFGARAIGEVGLGDYGRLNYWADVAGVYGRETVYDYDDTDKDGNDLLDPALTRVNAVQQNDVSGWALDVGAFWTLPIKYEPTFTLSYAYGSGDSTPNDGHNSTFRQTGINRNKWRFNGVNRFRIYGELFNPNLSNLGIFTTAVGFRLLNNSSIELVYHKYNQVEAVDSLRNSGLNADPNGKSKDLGQEFDIIMMFREWKRWELSLTGAIFDPGNAFNATDDNGNAINNDFAYSIFFDINYNF